MTTRTVDWPVAGSAGLERWARSQCLVRTLGDDWVRVDLDWWNRRLEAAGVPVVLRAGGADGGVVDHGPGYLCRADLWAAGRRAREGHGAAIVALHMCSAWLHGHPVRTAKAPAVPATPLDPPVLTGGAVRPHAAVEVSDDPGAALEALVGGRAIGRRAQLAERCGRQRPGWEVATVFLSCLDPVAGTAVPADAAVLRSAAEAGLSGSGVAETGDYAEFCARVGGVARRSGVHPLVVEEWLLRQCVPAAPVTVHGIAASGLGR